MTNTTYKAGDKVRILDVNNIHCGRKYWNNGDIVEVTYAPSYAGLYLKRNEGDTDGLVILKSEMRYIEKVEEAPKSAVRYEIGDKVRILSVLGIDCASPYWKVGDITTIVAKDYDGDIRLARYESDKHGLVILKSEMRHVAKVVSPPTYDSFRIGDYVRILDVDRIQFAGTYFKTGDVVKVVQDKRSHGHIRLDAEGHSFGGLIITEDEIKFLEKVVVAQAVAPSILSATETTPTQITRILALEAKVDSLEAKVHALESGNVGTPKLSTISFAGGVMTGSYEPVEVPNSARAAIIAKAKTFVKRTTSDMNNEDVMERGNHTMQTYLTKPVFSVDGRTVSVIVIGAFGCGREFERASATAAPGDVFNRHIGEAIALGRAMGLDVGEFENAPKPTKPVIGMVVEVQGSIQPFTGIVSAKAGYRDSIMSLERTPSNLLAILEDTDAEYGMGAF